MLMGGHNHNVAGIKKLAAAALVLAVILGLIGLWHTGVFRELSNKDQLIDGLRHGGVWGPLLCVTAQFVQVVIFIIPGEITQFAAGYVFGAWYGLAYSLAGILLGSAFNFYIARWLGRRALATVIRPSTFDRMDAVFAKPRGKSAMFFLFLLPGAPKDALCYAAGLSHMGLVEFLVLSGLGRLPALFASILAGSRLYYRDLRFVSIIGFLAIVAFVCFYLYERQTGSRP